MSYGKSCDNIEEPREAFDAIAVFRKNPPREFFKKLP